jgi:hypothetical protein
VRVAAAAALLLIVAGCGGGSGLPPESDAALARTALAAGLDAWKNGQKPADLTSHSPPIYFTDLAWQGGQRLEKYEIESATNRSGQSVVLTAVLTLRPGQGAAAPKKVSYLIDTSPTAVVIVPGE